MSEQEKNTAANAEETMELTDLQPEAQELSPADAESVRGGIIVQGGGPVGPVGVKLSSADAIQSFSWGMNQTG